MDTERLRIAVNSFAASCRRSSWDNNETCTISDLNKAVERIAEVLTAFIDEIEKESL